MSQNLTRAKAEKNKCVCKTLLLRIGKERKGFLNYGLYSVLCLVAHLFTTVSLEYVPLRHNTVYNQQKYYKTLLNHEITCRNKF